MNWYNYQNNFEHIGYELWDSPSRVSLNDVNLKPDWVKHPAKYSEFHVSRGKGSILLVIGESWAYGETLPGIATAIQKYDFRTQIKHGFGSRMALALGTDYYQYAVPGNCNLYMFKELNRILEYIASCGYKKIYVCMQMTEPGRELAICETPAADKHPIRDLYNYDSSIDFREWLRLYDEMFFDIYQKTLEKYNHLDINAMLWKNFCKTNTDRRDYKFKIVETSWIQYSARMLNIDLAMPEFYAVGWFDSVQKEYKNLEVDPKWGNEQLDTIAASNDFIKSNYLHNNHPSIAGHLLWAQFLLREAGWKHGI